MNHIIEKLGLNDFYMSNRTIEMDVLHFSQTMHITNVGNTNSKYTSQKWPKNGQQLPKIEKRQIGQQWQLLGS